MKASPIDESALAALQQDADSLSERIIGNRRRIHEQPELGLNLPKTQAVILAELERIGIVGARSGAGLSSVVADIEGLDNAAAAPGSGRRVALRADMDALPLTENNGLPYASKVAGCMHACGHDAHVAMLLGAAEVLMKNRHLFAGSVRLMFQPGEEGFGGAKIMIEEGVLDGVEAAFALHIDSSSPLHTLSLRKGPIMASADSFAVIFHGAGGHASMPHLTRDPIPAIGPFVDGLSHVAARETDPDDRAIFSVTKVVAGTTLNVVPPTAECYGTIRTLSVRRRKAAHAQLRRVAEGVAASRGLTVEVTVHEGYPPTVNHDGPVDLLSDTARAIGLRVHEMPSPMMGAEDFSYVLENVPGAIAFLGVRCEGGAPLHSDLMKLDESMLAKGAALHAAAALWMLAS